MTNFTVKCTKVLPDANKDCFYVGKTYRIENGRIKAESGYKFDAWAFNGATFENLQRWFENTFEFELVEEEKMFTKSDLRTGDWLVKRDGIVEQVFLGTKFGDFSCNSSGYHNEMNVRNGDLTSKMSRDFDIIRVIRPTEIIHFSERHHNEGEVVFDREKGIGCEPEHKFKIGDYVKVSDMGNIYSSYIQFIEKMLPNCKNSFIEFGEPHDNEILKVVACGDHLGGDKDFLYIVKDKTTRQVFVFGEDGLERA